MLRFTILAVSFVAICAMSIDTKSNSAGVREVVAGNLGEYFAANREQHSLVAAEPEIDADNHTIIFRFGQREEGDNYLSWYERKYTAERPINRLTSVGYPLSPNDPGSIVTFVEVVVKQSNLNATAGLFEGGIGQRNVAVGQTSHDVTFHHIIVSIYGLD